MRNSVILLLIIAIAATTTIMACGKDINNSDAGSDADGDTDGDTDGDSDGDADRENYPPVAITAINMVDDLEDGDAEIIKQVGRAGSWYIYNDESQGSLQTPVGSEFSPGSDCADGSSYCAHTSGSGFTEWGAGMGFDLRNLSDVCNGDVSPVSYNAEVFDGIAFMAKGNCTIRVKLPVPDVVPVEYGGSCTEGCEDVHGRSVRLSDTWRQYQLRYEDAVQEGWAKAADFDPSQLLGIQFDVENGVDFDFAIDDVAFFSEKDLTNKDEYLEESNEGPSNRPILSGFRASRYGITPFPSPSYWTSVGTQMASYVEDGTPAGLWIVGQAMDTGYCDMVMTNPGGYFPNVSFQGYDPNEEALDYFDDNGVKVILQVESSSADVSDLIDIVLNEYSGHPSVIGFGVDVEFYQYLSNDLGKAVSDDVAENWLSQIQEHNPDYILMLKHFDPYKLPECARDDILFVNDSQNNTEEMIMDEFTAWANYFAPGDVGFQIGYPDDRTWWSDYDNPTADMSEILKNNYKNTAALFWVDFSVKEVFPSK